MSDSKIGRRDAARRALTVLGAERIYELYGGTERQASTIIPGVEWVKRKGSVGRVEIGAPFLSVVSAARQ